MINIWEYANKLPNLEIETTEGQRFSGKVIAVFDAEESGEEQDNLALELKNGRIVSFYPSDIKTVRECL